MFKRLVASSFLARAGTDLGLRLKRVRCLARLLDVLLISQVKLLTSQASKNTSGWRRSWVWARSSLFAEMLPGVRETYRKNWKAWTMSQGR